MMEVTFVGPIVIESRACPKCGNTRWMQGYFPDADVPTRRCLQCDVLIGADDGPVLRVISGTLAKS